MPAGSQSTSLAPVVSVPGGFVQGHDPRRAIGGMPSAIREVKALLAQDAPAARTRLLELMASRDEAVSIRATELLLAYSLGKPKQADEDVQELLRQKFREAWDKLGEVLSPEINEQVRAAVGLMEAW